MKKFRLLRKVLLSIILIGLGLGLNATNIVVSDIVIVERNDADKYIIVQFNLSWDYSFRVDDGANTNWDAAWVFLKYKRTDQTNVQWGHATLAASGHQIPGNYTSSLGATGGVNKGIFIYPSVIFANTAQINGVRLRWNYGTDGLLPEHEVDIRVFGIEMVYVPTGSFYVGSGSDTEDSRFHAGGEATTTPFQIGSASFTVGNTAGNLWATGNVAAGALAGGYPTGYSAFYMMKHNITQQAYVDFLNTLTYDQQNARIDGSPGDAAGTFTNNANRHRIRIATQGVSGVSPAVYETDNPYIPLNFFSPNDLLSYLDWAALRPFTELEYEKAARGPASPVPNEFAWGNTRVGQVTAITNAGTATEAPVPSGYQRDITIDHTKVNETLTDFPILIRLDNDNFNFNQCRSDGFDFRFYDSNGDLLSYQRERHDFAAKKAEYWVKVPTISGSQNTVITLEYGNLLAADGADPANVWDASFVSLWHLNEVANGTASEYKDSKSTNHGTGIGTVATNVEGQVGKAQNFGGAGAISVTDHVSLDLEDFVTISGWVKPQALSGVSQTLNTTALWNDYHSILNLTTASDKLAVNTKPGFGRRVSKSISLNSIKKVGSSSISWNDNISGTTHHIVAFTSNGTFTVPIGTNSVDVLVVAGGGGGCGVIGGGGGAGGVLYTSNYAVTPGASIAVVVGTGGAGGNGWDNPAENRGKKGGNSSFGASLIAEGGGGGRQYSGTAADSDGGSGGGGSYGNATGGTGVAGQGFAGGNGGDMNRGAGGGGAGAVGQNTVVGGGGNGGVGVDYSSIFGTAYGDNGWFGGGGGGGLRTGQANNPGTGGQGGGGNGTKTSIKAGDGLANTGGGGGGAGYDVPAAGTVLGGNGGSGIVLVRYSVSQSVRVYTAINESASTPPDFNLNVQVFNSSGTFNVPTGVSKVDVLVVAGGGGGAGSVSGGGGAGGLVWQEGYAVTPGASIAVTVGAGGAGGATNSSGNNGQNSSFGSLEAIGGGRGGAAGTTNTDPGVGGSGGGGARYGGTNTKATGGAGTASQGYSGGNVNPSADSWAGGGGAGGVGQSVASGAGNGGVGRDFSQILGTSVGQNGWFAGGGGGGIGAGTPGAGGLGGGGNGIIGATPPTADNHGMPNTGGGGGGGWTYASGAGGNGGSGVVIVRWGYATSGDPIPGINTGDDLTGKYLWIMQELTTNHPTESPELNSLSVDVKGEAILSGKGEDAYQLSYYDGNLRGYINSQVVSSALTLDQYQHVAISYNGSFQRIYVNGLLTSTLALSGSINTNATNLLMGKNLIGQLDEVRMSSSARSQAWLKAEYHSGVGDLVQIGGEAQNNNAVFGNINWGGGVGQGPLRVGFGASPTSSRTASGASYWGIMELSGNLWERLIPVGRASGRAFTGLHGDGLLDANGLFNTANWPADMGNRGGQFQHANTLRFRVSDRQSMGWDAAWANRAFWQSGRGVRTAP